MSDHDEMWRRFQAHGAERFDSFAEWAAGSGLPPALGAYYIEKAPGSWWVEAFRTFKALNARGLGYIAKPLALPEARTAADVFDAARYLPTPPGGLYRDEAERLVARQAKGDGFRFLSSSRGAFAPCGQVGGKRDWSPDWLARGEKLRRIMGSSFYATYAKPNAAVIAYWRDTMTDHPDRGDFGLGGFEAVDRGEGGVLIIGRATGGIGARWLALLDPGATIGPLLPPEDLELIAREKAAAVEAWGEAG